MFQSAVPVPIGQMNIGVSSLISLAFMTQGTLLYNKDDRNNERIALPSGKIYIVKAGEKVRKVITNKNYNYVLQ